MEIVKEEKSVSQIAAEYGIHSNQLYKSKIKSSQVYRPFLMNKQKRICEKKKKNGKKSERHFTRKLDDQPRRKRGWKKNLEHSLKRDERVELIDWEQKELPISSQARLLHLNRSSLYYQLVLPSPE